MQGRRSRGTSPSYRRTGPRTAQLGLSMFLSLAAACCRVSCFRAGGFRVGHRVSAMASPALAQNGGSLGRPRVRLASAASGCSPPRPAGEGRRRTLEKGQVACEEGRCRPEWWCVVGTVELLSSCHGLGNGAARASPPFAQQRRERRPPCLFCEPLGRMHRCRAGRRVAISPASSATCHGPAIRR